MPRARTGQLYKPGRDGNHRARLTEDLPTGKIGPDGRTTTRVLYSLGTPDQALARRRLAKMNAALANGETIDAALRLAGSVESVRDYAEAWMTRRKASGIAMADYERRYLERHSLDSIGMLAMGEVTPSHVRSILDDAVSKGLKRATVVQVRGALHRLFDEAWRAGA